MATIAPIDAVAMAKVARGVLGMSVKEKKSDDETFRGFFGAPIPVIVIVWNMLVPSLAGEKGPMPKHLLWSLVFLKVHSTTAVHCRIVNWPDPKTFRKWCWYFLKKVAALKPEVIKLDNRFNKWDEESTCLISVDGTDCMINEPWPFSEKWHSQKFNGPAVKCEVGVCIATGHIVWTNGPYPASHNDGAVFKDTLAHLLAEDEGVEVDAGYMGHAKFKTPTVALSSVARKQKSVVRGRHENVNSRLKIFTVLNIPFRHLNPRSEMMAKHGLCFDGVAVLTQLKFEQGETLCALDYDVSYD